MNHFRLTDLPHAVPASSYEEALGRMTDFLRKKEGILAVYQLGGVTSPGISDLDMLVVTEDNLRFDVNPLMDLPGISRYLFIHSLYGISVANFHRANQYSFYSTFRKLEGKELTDQNKIPDPGILRQVISEYMVKMYINLVVQHAYRVIRIRDLFLHIKGFHSDLQRRGNAPATLTNLSSQCMKWRETWFEAPVNATEISSWFVEFFRELEAYLGNILRSETFYLPADTMSAGKNIRLHPAEKVRYTRRGIILPFVVGGKKYRRMLNRLNKFEVYFPFQSSAYPENISSYLAFCKEMQTYQRTYLPHFYPLSSSLKA